MKLMLHLKWHHLFSYLSSSPPMLQVWLSFKEAGAELGWCRIVLFLPRSANAPVSVF